VLLHGDTFDDARELAMTMAREQGLSFVHPFDDTAIIAGQGTIGIEMLRAQPQLDTLVIAVGGGGLISGISSAVRALKPDVDIIGVQTRRFPAMVNAIQGTTHPQGLSTIAEGIAVGQPGLITREIIRRQVNDLVLVDEGDIEQAIVMLLEIEKTLVEGAGAAGLAALLNDPARFAGKKVGLVLCGGNIDPLLLSAILERGLVRAGRLARIRVNARDTPGVLARITAVVAQAGANIDEVHHQRAFSTLSAQSVEVELVLQTRNPAHVGEVVAQLLAAGFEARVY
jgi:threonine dehydratase